ncbi:hypothetical protein WN943_010496 [Citrus x changshan-huyou]
MQVNQSCLPSLKSNKLISSGFRPRTAARAKVLRQEQRHDWLGISSGWTREATQTASRIAARYKQRHKQQQHWHASPVRTFQSTLNVPSKPLRLSSGGIPHRQPLS